MGSFQKRINYQGNLNSLLEELCQDFNIGKYKSYEEVSIGYEDFNLFLLTEQNKYFIKIFGSFRDKSECTRYVEVMKSVLKVGVTHPKLYKSNKGYLYETTNEGLTDRLCVMDFIDGNIFYELKTTPTIDEMKFIIKQVALINKINIKPPLVYDHWAITSFLKEYKEKSRYLNDEDRNLLQPSVEIYNSLDIEKLPHCFVHGDITKTNMMRSKSGDLYILDFAVSNYYPRIQELAAILSDLFFNPQNTDGFLTSYNFALDEYQKYITLTTDEIKKLPDCIKLTHTMRVLLANYEKVVNKNNSAENNYFLEIGKKGLAYIAKIWN